MGAASCMDGEPVLFEVDAVSIPLPVDGVSNPKVELEAISVVEISSSSDKSKSKLVLVAAAAGC